MSAPQKPRARRPHLTNAELLAMSRMLRLHLHDDRFFNPIHANETRKLALHGMAKIEGWRAGGCAVTPVNPGDVRHTPRCATPTACALN